MKLRTWMLLVLVTAAVLARGLWAHQMKSNYQVWALYHAANEQNCRFALTLLQSPPPSPPAPAPDRRSLSRLKNTVASTPGSKDLLTSWDGPPIQVEVPPSADEVASLKHEEARLMEKIAYHARMRRKYERLTWLPWLPAWPDPPEPK
jgi:hypothetical protein